MLAGFQGYLVVDGYQGYQALFGPASPRTEVGCWMHARRGFERAYQAGDARGGTVLALVQKLYAVERQATETGLSPEARLGLRLEKSAPVYAELFDLLEEWAPHVPPKTPLGKAIAYARNRCVPLGRFLENGREPVDNGEVERLIRMIAVACQASSSGRSVRSVDGLQEARVLGPGAGSFLTQRVPPPGTGGRKVVRRTTYRWSWKLRAPKKTKGPPVAAGEPF